MIRGGNRGRRVRGRKVAPPAVTVATERSVPPEESATTTAGTGQNVTLPPPPPQQTRARTPTPPESLERNPAKKARQGDGSSDSEGDYSSDQPEPADAEESTDMERDSLQHTICSLCFLGTLIVVIAFLKMKMLLSWQLLL